jgi:hypothetical protein
VVIETGGSSHIWQHGKCESNLLCVFVSGDDGSRPPVRTDIGNQPSPAAAKFPLLDTAGGRLLTPCPTRPAETERKREDRSSNAGLDGSAVVPPASRSPHDSTRHSDAERTPVRDEEAVGSNPATPTSHKAQVRAPFRRGLLRRQGPPPPPRAAKMHRTLPDPVVPVRRTVRVPVEGGRGLLVPP